MQINPAPLAMLILGFVLLYILVWIFIKPVKLILKLFANSTIGALCLVAFNYVGSLFGITLGVNLYSSVLCGILGVPGFIMLLCSKMFIR